MLLLAVAVANIACYLPYTVFDDWWYLRFLLPAIPLLIVLAVGTFDAALRRTLAGWAAADRIQLANRAARYALTVGVVGLAVLFIREARARQVFDLARLESRYVSAGRFVDARLPSNALIVTSWESGSVRFYSSRRTLTWDALDPAWLDRAIAFVRLKGFEPYLLFERWEEPHFRRRFGGSSIAALDWPPMAEVASQVRVYKPDDRARYYAGANVSTEYVDGGGDRR
jgi:hypothetical protein